MKILLVQQNRLLDGISLVVPICCSIDNIFCINFVPSENCESSFENLPIVLSPSVAIKRYKLNRYRPSWLHWTMLSYFRPILIAVELEDSILVPVQATENVGRRKRETVNWPKANE